MSLENLFCTHSGCTGYGCIDVRVWARFRHWFRYFSQYFQVLSGIVSGCVSSGGESVCVKVLLAARLQIDTSLTWCTGSLLNLDVHPATPCSQGMVHKGSRWVEII